ncbi:uncharacterized protein [Periplaneta americana]|uniref:uncharacterized protein n=1 Tax=Periplaneta americana TaxID=6978 RepID=UPI0037E8ACBB
MLKEFSCKLANISGFNMPNKRACCAPRCTNVYKSGCKMSFFAFPREPARCQKWLRFCGLEDQYRLAADVTEDMRLCINHFHTSEYYCGKVTRLNATAIPSIHCNGADVSDQNRNGTNRLRSPSYPCPYIIPVHKHKALRTYTRKSRVAEGNPVQCMEVFAKDVTPSSNLKISPHSSKTTLSDSDSLTVIMNVSDTQKMHTLSQRIEDITDGDEVKSLSTEGRLLEMNMNRIKMEPSEMSFDNVLDIKSEKYDSCSVLKLEIKDMIDRRVDYEELNVDLVTEAKCGETLPPFSVFALKREPEEHVWNVKGLKEEVIEETVTENER